MDMKRFLRVLLGSRRREILRLMQRSVTSSTLHIARTFKDGLLMLGRHFYISLLQAYCRF